MKRRIGIVLCVCFLFVLTAYGETFAPGFSAQSISPHMTYKSWWTPYGGSFGFEDGGVVLDWSKDVNASVLIAPKAITLGDYSVQTDLMVEQEGVFCVAGARLSYAAARDLREPREPSDGGLPGATWQGDCVGGVYVKLFRDDRLGLYVSDGKASGKYFYYEVENAGAGFSQRKTLRIEDTGDAFTVYVNNTEILTLRFSDLYGTNYRDGVLFSAAGQKLAAFSDLKIPSAGYFGFAVRGGVMKLWDTKLDGNPEEVRRTPMMGWSSWNAFGANIDETKIRQTADVMHASGLLAAGYEYVNVDDGYQSRSRDGNGNVGYNQSFASGMKSLGDYIHDKGLMYGIYTANGIETCLGYPGMEYNEERDSAAYASYGVDFIKVDYCLREVISYSTTEKIYRISACGTTYPATAENCRGGAVFDGEGIGMIEQNIGYAEFSVSAPTTGKHAVTVDYKQTAQDRLPLFIRINDEENYRVYYLPYRSTSITVMLPLKAGTNTISLGNPIRPAQKEYDGTALTYAFISDALDEAAREYAAANGELTRQIKMEICEWGGHSPWLWGPNFATMWRTGNDINASWEAVNNCYNHCVQFYAYAKPGAFNDPDILEVGNIQGITLTQEKTHFSLWCMMNSPLLLGNDIRNMRPEILEIITNEDAIAINQDARAIPCIRYLQSEGVDYLAKPLTEGRMAIAVYNTKAEPVSGTISLAQMAQRAQRINSEFYDKHFDLKASDIYYAYEVWSKKTVAMSDTLSFQCEPYGVCMYIIDTEPMVVEDSIQIELKSAYTMEENTRQDFTFGLFNASEAPTEISGNVSVSDGFTVSSSNFSYTLGAFENKQCPFTITAASENGTITIHYTARFANGKEETKSYSSALFAGKKAGEGALTVANSLYAMGGYQTYRDNLSFDMNPLTVGGTVYSSGIGVHAGSDVVYYLGGQSWLFKASMGLDDEQAQNNNVIFEVWGDDALLYRSPAISKGMVKELCIYVENKETLHLVVTQGNDGHDAYDHADWITPRLVALPSPSFGKLSLADAAAAWAGYGENKQNTSIDGAPLTVAGVVYLDGIGTHAAGEVIYYVGGQHAIFTAGVGIDDEAWQDYANVDIQIYGDDTLLWETKNLCRGEKKDICVELDGYQLLRLVTGDNNGFITHDHVDWLEPQIHAYRPVLARFTDENGVRAETVADASRVATDTLDADADGELFAAGYQGGRLVYAKKLTADAPLPTGKTDCVKVFVWKQGTLLPLGEVATLE